MSSITPTSPINGGNVSHTSPANVTWNARLSHSVTDYPTYVSVTYTGIFYVHGSAAPYLVANRMTATLNVGGVEVKKYTGPSSQTTYKGATTVLSYTATYSKGTAVQSKAVSFKISVASASSWSGNSTASGTLSISALDRHTISYNANGGTGSIESQTKYYGQNLFLSDGTGFSRAHYTLTGWNTAADGSGTAYGLGAEYSIDPTKDITLYAQWTLNAVIAGGKASGTWKEGMLYAKANGAWVIPYVGFVKVNNEWKEIIL